MEYNTERDYSDVYRGIGAVIVCERKKRHMRQGDLLRELQLRGVNIARNKLSAIENGAAKNITSDFLLAVCDILECDIGFLFGEYDEKTRELHDIAEFTGLNERALKRLHGSIKTYKPKGKVSSLTVSDIPVRERRVINTLLTTKAGNTILNYMFAYLFVRYDSFLMQGEYDESTKSFKKALESDTVSMYGNDIPVWKVHPNDVEEVIALRVYQSLNDLRKESLKEESDNG